MNKSLPEMKCCFIALFVLLTMLACNEAPPVRQENHAVASPSHADLLREQLSNYVHAKQAQVGIAIMGPDGDTITLNGEQYFPLMSVAKFPQALALLHGIDEGHISPDTQLHFSAADLKQRTASTIRKDHPEPSFNLSIEESLRYCIGQSDNITSNKIFELEGGPAAVNGYVRDNGVAGVSIVTDYAHMGDDSMHENRGTPVAIMQLLHRFYSKRLLSDSSRALLWKLMVESVSGADRLKGRLPAGTVVGHKTGTSGTDAKTGITKALNDAGIVLLPDGRHYAIVVFVAHSKESAAMNAEIIATISRMAWDHFMKVSK